ncbi:putative short chain dehydrogenase/reductase [Microdochium trichocladiopsis]|uniref:Short chain dehydrogenase/reductase n=1 Tax=Microdochium trichocladiopsis TaxID=1682393 RepID=A0A9P8Y7P7_9PEZI|nr:putative short chain dehydrogenase/reductase [Microdochium trichocladiopsis]KAH7033720.1 putative short chain dehydrogenase/reductase [Microdochium trichocladiopsis]
MMLALDQLSPAATSALTVLGALWCLDVTRRVASLLWLHLRPSSLDRYLLTSSGKPGWALVTGATGGMGATFAHELASRGFNVVLHGRSSDKLRRLHDKLAAAHPSRKFRTVVIDAFAAATAGGSVSDGWLASLQHDDDVNLTVLVNNAGGAIEETRGTFDVMPADRLINDMALNALFPMLLIRQVIPLLERSGRGLILNIGSLADVGMPTLGSYPGSKSAMVTLATQLNREMMLSGLDIEVLHTEFGAVYHETQTVVQKPGFLEPEAEYVVRAALGKVGCGRPVVVAHWAHALGSSALAFLPRFVLDRIFVGLARDLHMVDLNLKKD